jgi:Mn-dependent DtxR family transcriptional regulator
VLYGQLEYYTLKPHAIWPMAFITIGIVAGIILFYRKLLVTTFDPAMAISVGIAAGVVHYALLTTLSLTIVASFEAVGAVLSVSLLILPGATARLWTDRFSRMLMLVPLHAALSTLIGYWLSHEYVMNTSAGAAIGVAGFGLFVISWLAAPRQGLISQWVVRRQLRRKIRLENLVKTLDEMSQGTAAPLQKLAEQMNLPPAVAQRTAIAAERRGWVSLTPSHMTLTPSGHLRSQQLANAHLAWEQYLQQTLGLPPDHVHDAAEWVEHHLDEVDIERLKGQG